MAVVMLVEAEVTEEGAVGEVEGALISFTSSDQRVFTETTSDCNCFFASSIPLTCARKRMCARVSVTKCTVLRYLSTYIISTWRRMWYVATYIR